MYDGTERASQYRQVVSWSTDDAPGEIRASDRSLTDYISPIRAGMAVDVVNAVVREVGPCAESWAWTRVLRFADGLQMEARQRE